MTENLYEIVKMAQEHDEQSMEFLLKKFQPLIKKYTYLLRYEDAYSDLQLGFISIIHTVNLSKMWSRDDAHVFAYIAKSFYHAYIELSKKRKLETPITFSALIAKNSSNKSDEADAMQIIDQIAAQCDTYLQLEWDFLWSVLTEREAKIIQLAFYFRYTTNEISELFNVTPAAISQSKSNALKKLKLVFKDRLLG